VHGHSKEIMAKGNDTAERGDGRGGGEDFGYNCRGDEGQPTITPSLDDEPTSLASSSSNNNNNNNDEYDVGGRHGHDNNDKRDNFNSNNRNFNNDDDDDDDDDDDKEDNVDHLPSYLSPIVQHYRSEFYVSRSFDPQLIVQLMAEVYQNVLKQLS
jgi:hypothetical protein